MEQQFYIFTGGYTEPTQMASGEIVPGQCPGIGCYRMDSGSGALERLAVTVSTPNPSCILVDPELPYLYCVNEIKDCAGIPGATISAYQIDPDTGELTLLNRQFSGGADPCFLCFSPDRRYLLAANYSGSSVCVLPVLPDHTLGPATCVLRHCGHGVNPERQEKPHPHQLVAAPDGAFVYVPDLGLDRVVCYRADWTRGWLHPMEEADALGLPGQGTRHCVFNAGGTRLYVMTEMSGEINVYARDPASGKVERMQTISAVAPDWKGLFLGAAIRLHPEGRLLICSVRGSNELVLFRVGPDGCLRLLRHLPSGGEIPRDFILTPDGRWLLAGNQDSRTICVFSVGTEEGTLTPVWTQKDAGSVTTLAFWQRRM